jgi:mono/diheme cytochrome c family protein
MRVSVRSKSARSRSFAAGAAFTAVIVSVVAFAAAALSQTPGGGSRKTPPVQASPASQTDAAKALTTYCVVCHNARLKTAGLVLNPADLADVGTKPEIWEKVVGKLRSQAMPPAGMPRPDEATYGAVASFLETNLDRIAAGTPNSGSVSALHRLTRTEYQNAIRDLLALDALPREMDYSLLLPADNTSSGFDNIADLLFVSPTSMESYVNAARKISRLAVGDPTIPVMVNTYRLSPEQPQDDRVGDLPFGTRGGLSFRSYFPLDGEYAVKVEMAGAAREPQQLEISVDGIRMHLEEIGIASGGGRGRGASAAKPMEFRVPVKAGPRLVGVTFIQHTEATDEATLRPRMRGRGTEPALATVTLSGPYNVTGPGDTPSRRRIFVCHPANASEELPCAKRILSTLARRAYRRPVSEPDLADVLPFYTAGRAKGNFELGIQKALERLLVSPQFLFRIERDPANVPAGTPYRLSDLELASRLSFFLWSSLPDDQLLEVAAAGKLKDPAVLEQQVRRMLADPRSESLVTNFAEQWLFLRDIGAKQPDELLFPDFDESLRDAFREEADLFLDSVLRSDRSVLDLLAADYTFVNERLAQHYGIPNISGSYFRRVTFPPGSPRGGLLGQGSILTITSYSTRTSPVLRGKWVLENILSSPPPPPPPNVPALATESKDTGTPLTMREAMTLHRAQEPCASCHARMDPIGFAMDNFDAVGRFRTSDAGKLIDPSGVLPNGTKFSGVAELKQALLQHPEQFVSTVAEKLLMYAIGRNVQYYDQPAVRAIVDEAAQHNYTFSSLVMGVAKSVPFQMRESKKAETHPPETAAAALRR